MDLEPLGIVPPDDDRQSGRDPAVQHIESLLDDGKLDEAVAAIQEALAKGDGNALDLAFLLGDAYLGLGRAADAEVQFRELGIQLAIGWTPGQIFRMVVWESVWLALVGLVCAAVLTAWPYWWLATHGVDLRASYGDKHPKIQDLVAERGRLEKRIGQEVERIVASLRNDLDVTANRVATIQDQLDQVAAVNSKRHEMTIELNQLEREAQTSRQLYELFLQRFNETREQENVIMPDAKVISQAMVPTSPKTPSMLVFGLVGFVVSGLAGCVCALLRDRLSTSMLCREDVERFLKLPTVAVVPKLRSRERPHTHLLSNSFSPFSDAISAAHTMLAAGEGGTPRSILLTSSIPEEGKTTMAVSLACFAAMSGVRTLLIDCDLRRPGVAGKLNICPTTGLTDYLCDGAPADDLVITEAQGGFDCILTERLRRNPTVPLSSQRMRDLMRWASARYDLILVDAPPLLGVPDAVIVASLVQQVLFISKWKTCTSSTILNALKQLGEACHPTDSRVGDNCSTRGSGDSNRYCGPGGTCVALGAEPSPRSAGRRS